MKTYIAVYKTRTVDEYEFRDARELKLIKAENQEIALQKAYEIHCGEAFDEGAPPLPASFENQAREISDERDMFSVPPGIGEWTTVDGHPAFQLGDDSPGVDRGCILWVKSVTEVPEADTEVLRRYL